SCSSSPFMKTAYHPGMTSHRTSRCDRYKWPCRCYVADVAECIRLTQFAVTRDLRTEHQALRDGGMQSISRPEDHADAGRPGLHRRAWYPPGYRSLSTSGSATNAERFMKAHGDASRGRWRDDLRVQESSVRRTSRLIAEYAGRSVLTGSPRSRLRSRR